MEEDDELVEDWLTREDVDDDDETEEDWLVEDEELEEAGKVVEVVEEELALLNVKASPPATIMIMITTTIPIVTVREIAFKNLDLRDESIEAIVK